ncbi:WGxxGxxG family protein [Paenibacillus mendelii]|uniref:WGxxGxxG family protein n=1 Tax=Paenibacillus mendelii TaxID=206163 RepID=A0ABV6JJB9_9BACL|nr:WGxxGxxG family protein [Paenibacillus mendelii]MCQ6558708.1 WGxxGxxG-CTERM domain-containing protein [Paenibacillus mendelii]
MKKRITSLCLLVCLTLLMAVPVFAQSMDTVGESVQTAANNDMNMNGAGGNNNYRAYANNDNDIDWGWLGLLGLIGLAGMRGRNREKT